MVNFNPFFCICMLEEPSQGKEGKSLSIVVGHFHADGDLVDKDHLPWSIFGHLKKSTVN